MNFTPYITHSISDKDPFEQRYFEPQYDMRDFVGRTVQVTKIEKNFPWEPWYDDRTYTNSEGVLLFVPMKMALTFQSLLMKFKEMEYPIILET